MTEPAAVILEGDAVEVLRRLPAESVHCVVTSPPFWNLRDYGTGSWDGGDASCGHVREPARWDKASPGGALGSPGNGGEILYTDVCRKCGAIRTDRQIGMEATPQEFAASLVRVFREVWRVLRPDGTLWVEIGDTYVAQRSYQAVDGKRGEVANERPSSVPPGLKAKDMAGVPWRFALAMQDDGWWLRSEVVWDKSNAMPERVSDRPSTAHSRVFMFARSERYFWDEVPIREQAAWERWGKQTSKKYTPESGTAGALVQERTLDDLDLEARREAGRRPRSVWRIPTASNSSAYCVACDRLWVSMGPPECPGCGTETVRHFAPMTPEVARKAIVSSTSEKGACARCGAPWQREVSREGESVEEREKRLSSRATSRAPRSDGGRMQQAMVAPPGLRKPMETLGWGPTCDCECDDVVPCVVLDPFSGGGTTALVARQAGRSAIGIELRPEYALMSDRRLEVWHVDGGTKLVQPHEDQMVLT